MIALHDPIIMRRAFRTVGTGSVRLYYVTSPYISLTLITPSPFPLTSIDGLMLMGLWTAVAGVRDR